MQYFAFCGDMNGCRRASPYVGGSGSLGLKAPVGSAQRCRNVAGDVLAVQRALNKYSPADGGPSPKLAEDSIYGPKTAAAIQKFQVKHFGYAGADGVVDPGQQTERKLAGSDSPASSVSADMYGHIGYARTVLEITRSQIAAARMFGSGQSSFTHMGESAWNKLITHFKIDQFPSWSTQLDAIDRVYSDMQTAIGHVPQGMVLFADEPPEKVSGHFAFAYANGYGVANRGKKSGDGSTYLDSIYFTQKMRTLKQDAFAYVMIHELAHYVGPEERSGVAIVDYAYHRNPAVYQSLPPRQRVQNADCYSQFAFDAIGKPFKHSQHLAT